MTVLMTSLELPYTRGYGPSEGIENVTFALPGYSDTFAHALSVISLISKMPMTEVCEHCDSTRKSFTMSCILVALTWILCAQIMRSS